mmetsp:Transcript_15578/g.25800  ORF Transcript_15578/g.25800 Transcript_15578/m.25800 type:complete len:250 (-) Transcript_15578:232-981(-)
MSLSFEITMTASTCCLNTSNASAACFVLRRPSKVKGKVTMPMVSLPISLAKRAITGAAPLPVPPPMPAVIKTKSAPSSAADTVSFDSSADFCPSPGSPPVPSPRVSFVPICSLLEAFEARRACASVFTAQKSTPDNSDAIIRLTALLPPPPTPITLIFTLSAYGFSERALAVAVVLLVGAVVKSPVLSTAVLPVTLVASFMASFIPLFPSATRAKNELLDEPRGSTRLLRHNWPAKNLFLRIPKFSRDA